MFVNSNYIFSISRDAELEADDGFLIGPPPPAMVAEAASANEAERFEEVHFQRHFLAKFHPMFFSTKMYFCILKSLQHVSMQHSPVIVWSTLFPDSYS